MSDLEHNQDEGHWQDEAYWHGFVVSSDPRRLDLERVHSFLTRTSWGGEYTLEGIRQAAQHSKPFGIFEGEVQVGYARVVTDYTHTAWLADVFILESHRGRGLAKFLLRTLLEHPRLQTVKWLLTTDDAHDLYAPFGFEAVNPAKFMIRPPQRHIREAVRQLHRSKPTPF